MDKDELIESSEFDEPITAEDVIGDSILIGGTPLETIFEGITNQFTDYINIQDKTNYVELFYNELDNSYADCSEEDEEHPSERKEMLDELNQKFIDFFESIMETKLALHINDPEEPDGDIIRRAIISVYEGFILNARDNFMNIISYHICNRLKTTPLSVHSEEEWNQIIGELVEGYSPIITEILPVEFLRLMKNDELSSLYIDDNVISGNFLRKYSPRLFQNPEFEAELIANTYMCKSVKEELYAEHTTTSTGTKSDEH